MAGSAGICSTEMVSVIVSIIVSIIVVGIVVLDATGATAESRGRARRRLGRAQLPAQLLPPVEVPGDLPLFPVFPVEVRVVELVDVNFPFPDRVGLERFTDPLPLLVLDARWPLHVSKSLHLARWKATLGPRRQPAGLRISELSDGLI